MSEKAKKSSEFLTPTMFDIKLLNFMFTMFISVVDPFKILRNYILKPTSAAAMSMYEEYKVKTLDKLDGSQSVIIRVIVVSLIGFLLFCGAVLIYVLFYLMYMPSSTHIKPAHMQYNRICENKACDLQSMTSPYHTFPMAHLQLNKNQLMMTGQPYHIYVRLEVPETPRNQDLGVFMICVDMKDKESFLKSHACRSTMLRYQSPWLLKVKTLLFMPFYVLGIREEKQDLDVEVFSNYVDTTNSVTDIYVEIQSKVVEFYGVSLQILAHFTGLRYIIFHFPVTSALVGIGSNFVVLATITLMLWYHYDYEMEWVDDARRKVSGKPKLSKETAHKSSSSISTVDDNLSLMDMFTDSDKLELEDDLMFGAAYDTKARRVNPEE